MGHAVTYATAKKCDARHFSWRLLVVSTLVPGLLWGQKCFSRENPELFRFIADGYEANLKKLRTWRGTAIRRVGRSSSQSAKSGRQLNFREEAAKRVIASSAAVAE